MSDNQQFSTKYRSKNLEEYIGNEEVKTAVRNRFSEEPFPSSVMVHGVSGCGKTTVARLIAKRALCQSPVKSVEGKQIACNECESCKQMDEYIKSADDSHLWNVQELDATRAGRMDAIEEFISTATTPSMYDDYRVHIIDECHRISEAAQNSLLKVIEDVPEKSIFIFCTTDPHKVLETLRTRMQLVLEVKLPTLENNVELLTHVCNSEGISFEKASLELIAQRSGFVYRKSLVALENVYRSHGVLTFANAEKTLGIVGTEQFFKFFKYLLEKNEVLYTQLIYDEKFNNGLRNFVNDLTDFVKKGIYITSGITVAGTTLDDLKKFKELFNKFSLEEVHLLLEFLDNLKNGDLESRLLILGYRGLGGLKTPVSQKPREGIISSSETLKLSEGDLHKEKRELASYNKDLQKEFKDSSETRAEEELKELTTDEIKDILF